MIADSAFHNLALLEERQVWAWGNDEDGKLSVGDTHPKAMALV